MKVCIVTPSFTGGGAERVAVNLANQYAKAGHDVTLLVFSAFGPYGTQVAADVKVVDLCVKRVRYVLLPLFSALRTIKPDVLLSVVRNANVFTGIACLLGNGFHLVFREANTMDTIAAMPMLQRFFYKGLMRLAYWRADAVIANSEHTKNDLVKHSIVGASKITVIGNPVLPPDYEALALEPPAHPWLLDAKCKVVLTVGRLHKQKNQAILIEAFANIAHRVDALRLIILGDGDERENLLALADRLGVAERMAIIPFQQNPYPYYKNADLFVLTSDWEGFGNVLVEAMGCSTPVISTDCRGGPRAILGDGRFGVLVPVGDVDALTEAIGQNFGDGFKSGLNAAKDRALGFGIEAVSEKYMQVMKSVKAIETSNIRENGVNDQEQHRVH